MLSGRGGASCEDQPEDDTEGRSKRPVALRSLFIDRMIPMDEETS